MKLRADDRVLFLAIPPEAELVNVARILIRGVLVAIGGRDEVDTARRRMADFQNAMFLEASPASIPWRDAYFTKIVVPPEFEQLARQIGSEIGRLLSPEGEVVHTGQDA